MSNKTFVLFRLFLKVKQIFVWMHFAELYLFTVTNNNMFHLLIIHCIEQIC